ncbi:ASCH domain-containing protein [Amycolatopsis alkalitolerans]|uniref:hypothetical protein n=1 Tax=Amycolatopsis alkalitolerans TaxID=2547244 RepID=UPI00190F3603|nr:hypothetical protein [Amycolatopsis alkalitolerans]
MPRLMSVAFTEREVRSRIKTVTRRKGWAYLRTGERITLCRKVMGRRPGEPLVRVAEVEVLDVRREPLDAITVAEVAREGFPGMSTEEFMRRFFIDAQDIQPSDIVTRIEWTYLDDVGDQLSLDIPRDTVQAERR